MKFDNKVNVYMYSFTCINSNIVISILSVNICFNKHEFSAPIEPRADKGPTILNNSWTHQTVKDKKVKKKLATLGISKSVRFTTSCSGSVIH